MQPSVQSFVNSLRDFKNHLLDNYYSFRIDTPQYPYQIVGRRQPYQLLFIFSHMRSGSSLLTHLLVTNPEIIGFGETHIQYYSEQDIKQLILKVYQNDRHFRMPHQYVLDKLLHDHKLIQKQLLLSNNLYAIFLLREPDQSLASILKLKPHWDEHKAIEYYCSRLSMLEDYAKLINSKERSLFITHHQLLYNTTPVFKALQNFLSVKEPFSEQYKLLGKTGVRGVGDSSKNIRAGFIVRTSQKTETSISEDLIKKGLYSFEQCCATLSDYCQTIHLQ